MGILARKLHRALPVLGIESILVSVLPHLLLGLYYPHPHGYPRGPYPCPPPVAAGLLVVVMRCATPLAASRRLESSSWDCDTAEGHETLVAHSIDPQ